jgi:hypothetical protein
VNTLHKGDDDDDDNNNNTGFYIKSLFPSGLLIIY